MSGGFVTELVADADTYFLRFKNGEMQNTHHGIEELKTSKMKNRASEFMDMLVMPRFPSKQTWILPHRLLRCRVRVLYCVRAIQPKCLVRQHGTEGWMCVNIQEVARQDGLDELTCFG